MSQQDKDSEFEAYLQGKSSLSDSYADLPQPKAPDHLDAAILAEAHRAVGARPGGRRWRSWMIPASMAATLFVAVIIGAQLRYLLPSDESPQAARSDSAVSGNLAKEMRKEDNVAAQDKTAAAPAPAPVEQKPARAPQRRMAAAPAPAPSNQPMADQAAPAAAAPAALAEKQEAVQSERAAPSAEAGLMARKKKALSEGEVSTFAAPPAAPEAAAAPAPQPGEQLGAAKADTASLRPEEWLARIRQLKQQGRLDEAKKELAAFKKRYPAYTLPKDLELR